MQKLFDNDYVEKVLVLDEGSECWYFLFFGVYYFKKLDSIRMVFDFLVKFYDVFFNDVLFKGFDFSNSLLGIFM